MRRLASPRNTGRFPRCGETQISTANSITSSFGTSSDYVGFLNLGIPSSGIFTGGGDPYDTCYHQACDDISNIHWEAITVNTKAAAHAAVEFALSLEGVPARNRSATPVRRGEAELLSWDLAMANVRAARPCSHEHEHDNLY